MCNWSETIRERAIEAGMAEGMEKGMEKERLNAIERMLKANATKEQILSYGYTEDEFLKAENLLCANV